MKWTWDWDFVEDVANHAAFVGLLMMFGGAIWAGIARPPRLPATSTTVMFAGVGLMFVFGALAAVARWFVRRGKMPRGFDVIRPGDESPPPPPRED